MTLRSRVAAWLAVGLVGGSILHSSETLGQEPKWSPQPFAAETPSAAASERNKNQQIPKLASTDENSSEFAPVQRWRKTDRTSRVARAQGEASNGIAGNFNEKKSLPDQRVLAKDQPRNDSTIAEPQRGENKRDNGETVAPVRFLRPPEGEPVQRARHDGSSANLRPSVVAARWSPEDNPVEEPLVPQVPVRLKTSLLGRDSSNEQDPQPTPTDPPAIPNPFPNTNSAETKDWVNDSPPAPPSGMQRKTMDCGEIRDFINNLDIHRIRIDSSPDFVEGYPVRDRALKMTKENFVSGAPNRTWYSQNGEEIARGKLLDLLFESALIEKEDGTKQTILLRKLSDPDQAYVAEAWGIPVTCSLGDQDVAERMFADSILTWKASGACHKPLYFEDVQLERYGHEWGPVVQPALSTVRFFGDLAVLPYKMGIHPPRECQYPLGYYRPGECAPWTHGPVPISLRGALSQAAFVTGTAWALP